MDVSTDVFQEISRLCIVLMYALFTGAVKGYHAVKDKYLEYKYAKDDVVPTTVYFLSEDGDHENVLQQDKIVPSGWVYVEEWVDIKGHKKAIVRYEHEEIPHHWTTSPFGMASAVCPWVWVGDKETEIDLTRTFDKFLVPGNRITVDLVSKLIKMTDHTNLIYIETKTFKHVKFPGEGITIQADVDETL